jgi:hypothetical protein
LVLSLIVKNNFWIDKPLSKILILKKWLFLWIILKLELLFFTIMNLSVYNNYYEYIGESDLTHSLNLTFVYVSCILSML